MQNAKCKIEKNRKLEKLQKNLAKKKRVFSSVFVSRPAIAFAQSGNRSATSCTIPMKALVDSEVLPDKSRTTPTCVKGP